MIDTTTVINLRKNPRTDHPGRRYLLNCWRSVVDGSKFFLFFSLIERTKKNLPLSTHFNDTDINKYYVLISLHINNRLAITTSL